MVRIVRTRGEDELDPLAGFDLDGPTRISAVLVDDLAAARSALRERDILLVNPADLVDGALPAWVVERGRKHLVVAIADAHWPHALPAAVIVLESAAHLVSSAPLLARWGAQLDAAQREARDLGELVDANPDAVVVTDDGGIVLRANAAAVAMFVAPGEELVGQSLAFSVGDNGTGQLEFLAEGQRRIGEIRLASVDWNGAPATLALVRDVTDKVDLQDQLAQSQKADAIRLMAGGISHEFNNMLVVAMTNLYFLRTHVGGEGSDLLDKIDEVVDRLRVLSEQIRILSQSHTSEARRTDLGALVAEHTPILRSAIPADIELEVDEPTERYLVVVDPNEMRQVVMNLVVNAMSATSAGGTIRIATGMVHGAPNGLPEGDWSTLTVSDTGSGIAPEDMPRIFDPFFTTKPVGAGRGLGLSVSRAYVRRAGGTIDVRSTPGKGTVVTIYLPGEGSVPEVAGAIVRNDDAAPHILLIEDDSDVATVVSKVLERGGFKVTWRDNGLEGKGLIEADQSIRLVVSDVVMPKLGGRDLAEWLIRDRPHVKLLLMTGYTDRVEWLEEIRDDTRDYILKPFPPKRLLSSVRRLLD